MEDERSVRGALASLSLTMVLSSLGTSIANVGLPALAEAFVAPFQHVQWVVIAYLLAVTSLVVAAGRLGDVVGRRRLLLGGIALFTAASAACGIAPTLWTLVAARAAQGLGAAVMMALTMALVSGTVPKARAGSAIGVLGSMSAIGTALGPSLGGILVSAFGWRAMFLATLPLGIVTLLSVRLYVPADRQAARPFATGSDRPGTVLLAATLAAYALAMTLGRGSFGALNVGLLLVAAAGVGLFLRAERRAASPLVPVALLRDPGLLAALGMSALVMTVLMATLVVGPFYLSRALALDAAVVGVVLSAGPVVTALTSASAGRFVDRFGERRMIGIGLAGVAAGALGLASFPRSLGVPGYVAPIAVMTAGYALFQAANTTAVLKEASEHQRGLLSGLLNLSRNLGMITGATVMGAVFAHASAAADVSQATPAAVAWGLRVTFAFAAVLIAVAGVIRAAGSVKPASLAASRTDTGARAASAA